MLLLDFRNWKIQNLGIIPNTQTALLKKDFEVLKNILKTNVLKTVTEKPLSLSSLFFENSHTVAVSAVRNLKSYYGLIDEVLDVKNKELIDYTEAIKEEVFFYGSESLVAHPSSEIALAGINQKTDESLFEEYCEDFELTPFSFDLPDGLFTRDIACFLGTTLLVCLDYISDKKTKKSLLANLKINGIDIITVSKEQVSMGILNFTVINDTVLMPKSVIEIFTTVQLNKLSEIEIIELSLSFLDQANIKLRDVII
ncbi:arginine deiminase-related protein [Wenyingzhuangia sp. IMCC45533]